MSTVQDLMGSGMSAQLADRLGNSPKTYPGNGTVQTTATVIRGQALNLLAPVGGDTAFVLSSTFSTGRPVFVWNLSGSDTALVFPPLGGAFDGGTVNAALSIAPNAGGILQLVDGSGTPAEEWFSLINGGGGGSGLPPGGFLDQPLTNDGTSGGGQWGNTLFARTSAPDSPPDTGAYLVLFGEQGGTGSGAGYGATVSAGGGRYDGGDGSYGGTGLVKGGNAGAYGGGYVNAGGANSDAGPGGVRISGGYAPGTAQNVMVIDGVNPFDLSNPISFVTGDDAVHGQDFTVTASPGAANNGNISFALNATTPGNAGNFSIFGLPTAVAGLPDDALWIEPGTGALIAAPGTGTGGGGGAAIEPESGPGIKISAITAAAFPMGADDVLTGLQDGANANFTQAQILSGQSAPSAYSAIYGAAVYIAAGAGDGAGAGGGLRFIAGNAGATSGNGGDALQTAGDALGTGNGGASGIYGGRGGTTGTGGKVEQVGGFAANGNGGASYVRGGSGSGVGYHGGHVYLGPGAGLNAATAGLLLTGVLPTSDPSYTQAVWDNNGILMFSGVTNYSGTTTVAGIGTKTLTIVNGIITSIA